MPVPCPPVPPDRRRIVFVVPPVTAEDRYGPMASAGNSLPPHAFLYLGAVAREAGWTPIIVDGPAEGLTIDETAARVLSHEPSVVGFTVTTMSVAKAAKVAEGVRAGNAGAVILVGGPHITALPEPTLERLSVFDLGVVGEGEDVLRQLLQRFERGEDPRDVPSVVFHLGDEGPGHGVASNPPSETEVDLPALPDLAWDLLEDFPHRYHAAATYLNKTPFTDIIVSRGCRYRCTFCDNQTFGRSIRALPVDRILENIDRLVQDYGVKSIFFTDDSLMTLREEFEQVCHGLIARNYDLEWSINARTSEIDEEILALMKRAGCWQISFGVESGSWEILKRIKKAATPRMQARALQLTHEAGIKSNAYIIIGFPGETKETLRETEEFLDSVPIDTLRLTYFTPFPNTDITSDLEGQGTIVADWTQLNFYNIAYLPNGLTAKDLERTYRRIMMKFYLRPRVLKSFLPHLIVPRKALALFRGTMGLGKLLLAGPGASGGGECHS